MSLQSSTRIVVDVTCDAPGCASHFRWDFPAALPDPVSAAKELASSNGWTLFDDGRTECSAQTLSLHEGAA